MVRLAEPATATPLHAQAMGDLVDRAAARLQRGSKSFAAAARLLSPAERDSMILLYSWCRHCDDMIDGEHLGFAVESPAGLQERLEALHSKTIEAINGQAREEEFLALQVILQKHQIPDRYPLELIRGMSMDVAGTAYHTIDDTLTYCYHVAGVVGVMSAIILGVRDRPTLEHACDLGIGFQLTNIARDVLADARRGRVYLPETWLREAKLSSDVICRESKRRDLYRVVRRLLDVSDGYYHSASIGISRLPMRAAWSIAAARRIYRGIGRQIEFGRETILDRRAATSRLGKLGACSVAAAEVAYLTSPISRHVSANRQGLWTPEALFA